LVKSSLLGGVCKAFIGGKEGSGAGPDEPSEEVGAELRPVRLAAPAALPRARCRWGRPARPRPETHARSRQEEYWAYKASTPMLLPRLLPLPRGG